MPHKCYIRRTRAIRWTEGGGSLREGDSQATDDSPLQVVDKLDAGVTALVIGAQIAHYEILELIGTGGMGEVYRALDTRLDRAVAIKVLRPGLLAHDRLAREAQAMARLSHPNVVTVHEIALVGGQLLIVMELVEGRTLRAWLAEHRRSWREIVHVFVRAGRGLAAAHRAGVVHRDFKPDNVLVGADGRVRVADFGVADFGGGDTAKVGTPRYMSPEQRRGAAVDARADQYAFAVSLHEALQREPSRERRGRRARVPGWLRAVVARGRAVQPAERWPSMEALLAALDRDPAAQRRRVIAALAAVGLAGALVVRALTAPAPCSGATRRLAGIWDDATRAAVRRAFLATGKVYAAPTYQRVASILDAYSGAWSVMHADTCAATVVRHEQSDGLMDLRMGCLEARRAELGALSRLLATPGDVSVLDGAVRAAQALGKLAGCADAEALGRAFPPAADPEVRARVATLRARLDSVEALDRAGLPGRALPGALEIAEEAGATGDLPLIAAAEGALATISGELGAPEAEARHHDAVIAAARVQDDRRAAALWTSLVQVVARRPDRATEALALADTAEAAVVRAGDDPLQRADLLGVRSIALDKLGRNEQARADAQRALALAEQALGPRSLALAPVLERLAATSRVRGRSTEARAYSERALAIQIVGLGARHPRVAQTLMTLAAIASNATHYAESLAYAEWARAIYLEDHGPDSPGVAAADESVAAVLRLQGRLDDALRRQQAALAVLETQANDRDELVRSLSGMGAILLESGRYAAALPFMDRAVAMADRLRSPNTFLLRQALVIRTNIAYQLGLDDVALADAERLVAINEAAGVRFHPGIAAALAIVARVRLARGDQGAALEAARRALVAGEKSVGPQSPFVTAPLLALGDLLQARGAYAEALADYTRALAIYQHDMPDNPELGDSLTGIGECQLGLHRTRAAVATLERSLDFLVRHPGPSERLAHARIALARALLSARQDRARALELAEEARDGYLAAGGARHAAEAHAVARQLAAWRP